MARIQQDLLTVQFPYTLPTLARIIQENDLSAAALVPFGIEIKPLLPPISRLIQYIQGEVGSLFEEPPAYISPWDTFIKPIRVIPHFPLHEKVTGFQLIGPIGCIAEDPIPYLNQENSRKSEGEVTRVGYWNYWAPGLFIEPFVQNLYAPGYESLSPFSLLDPESLLGPIAPAPTTAPGFYRGGVGSVQPDGYPLMERNLFGYYTDRNFYDREYILKYRDELLKINMEGVFRKDWNPSFGRETYPVNPKSIKEPVESNVNPFTFYCANAYGGSKVEEVAREYFRCAEYILGYKASEIQRLRFYFIAVMDSCIYPPYFPFTPVPASIPWRTAELMHMTVDVNNDLQGIGRYLDAQKLVDGPCGRDPISGNETTPDPSLSSECFRPTGEFTEGVESLNNYLQGVVDQYNQPQPELGFDPDADPSIYDE